MEYFPAPLEKLVEQFARLPGIGSKSAQRLAFHVLNLPMEQAQEFANAIVEAKQKVTLCPICRNLTEGEGPCPVCSNLKRVGRTALGEQQDIDPDRVARILARAL